MLHFELRTLSLGGSLGSGSTEALQLRVLCPKTVGKDNKIASPKSKKDIESSS